MNLQKFNILIVEDDTTFGESLKSALTRVGFRAYFVATPADAMAYIKLQDVHALIIDCMLPKMNGLELYKRMKDQLTGDPPVVLMSGIFKDRQFISSSKQKPAPSNFSPSPLIAKSLSIS